MVKVTCEERKFRDEASDFVGKTVQFVYDTVKAVLRVPEKNSSLKVKIDDNDAQFDDIVADGNEVEFIKAAGEKGN